MLNFNRIGKDFYINTYILYKCIKRTIFDCLMIETAEGITFVSFNIHFFQASEQEFKCIEVLL